MMTEKMTSASERYFSALTSMNREAFLSCFSEDAEVLDPYGSRPARGQEGLSKWFAQTERTWSGIQMIPRESYASGDRLAVRWEATGVAHSGKAATFSGINVFTIDDEGLISRLEGYWDVRQMMAQIS